VQHLVQRHWMLRPGGPPLPCCPICSESRGHSLKYHLKACARQTLAQLTSCPHCFRPIRRDDLAEHKARCAKQFLKRDSLQDKERQLFKAQAEEYHKALTKIESGEICNVDSRGLFACSVCGQKGIPLQSIVQHEEQCRAALQRDGHVPAAKSAAEAAEAHVEPEEDPDQQLASLVRRIVTEVLGAKDGGKEALTTCLESLKEVVGNACHQQEKKFRKLRRSNGAFSSAIGRWPSAIAFLEALGFQSTEHTNKAGEVEEHLVLAEPLPTEVHEVAIAALADGPLSAVKEGTPATTNGVEAVLSPQPDVQVSKASALLECVYCHRRFRFDRIAKHETRCPGAKPAPPQYDAVRHALEGTPGESAIPEARKILQQGFVLPPLRTKGAALDMGEECPRCGRRFNPESLAKHVKHCKGEALSARKRPGTSSTSRPSSASRTTGKPLPLEQRNASQGAAPKSTSAAAPITQEALSEVAPPAHPRSGVTRSRSRQSTRKEDVPAPPTTPAATSKPAGTARPSSASRRASATSAVASQSAAAKPSARPPLQPNQRPPERGVASRTPPQAEEQPAQQAVEAAFGAMTAELPTSTELVAASDIMPPAEAATPPKEALGLASGAAEYAFTAELPTSTEMLMASAVAAPAASASPPMEAAPPMPRELSGPEQVNALPDRPALLAEPCAAASHGDAAPTNAAMELLPPTPLYSKASGKVAPTYEDLEVDVAEWLSQ